MRRTNALIVGGGPAGAATAITLARAGASAHLIERRRERGGVVCGGFLGWDALASLERLGIDVAGLGAQPIARVRLIAGDRIAEARLPRRAAGLSRATLDAALLDAAAEAGARIDYGLTVRELDGARVRLADATMLEAETLVVATGKHALRGCPREGAGAGMIGLRTTIAAAPDLAGTIELHLFRGGYAGLLVQEDGRANLSISIAPARFADAGGRPEALIAALAHEAPRLADRVGGGDTSWSTVAAVPYGWRAHGAGPFRVGDQAAVIASLVGDGIAIALASGRAAAAAVLRGDDPAAYQRAFAARARRPLAVAEAARAIAERPRLACAALPWFARMPGLIALLAHATRIGA